MKLVKNFPYTYKIRCKSNILWCRDLNVIITTFKQFYRHIPICFYYHCIIGYFSIIIFHHLFICLFYKVKFKTLWCLNLPQCFSLRCTDRVILLINNFNRIFRRHSHDTCTIFFYIVYAFLY